MQLDNEYRYVCLCLGRSTGGSCTTGWAPWWAFSSANFSVLFFTYNNFKANSSTGFCLLKISTVLSFNVFQSFIFRSFVIQVDGEPCRLGPSVITIEFHSKVPVLQRIVTKVSYFRYKAEPMWKVSLMHIHTCASIIFPEIKLICFRAVLAVALQC